MSREPSPKKPKAPAGEHQGGEDIFIALLRLGTLLSRHSFMVLNYFRRAVSTVRVAKFKPDCSALMLLGAL